MNAGSSYAAGRLCQRWARGTPVGLGRFRVIQPNAPAGYELSPLGAISSSMVSSFVRHGAVVACRIVGGGKACQGAGAVMWARLGAEVPDA